MLLHAVGLAILVGMVSMSGKGMTSMQEQSIDKEHWRFFERDIRVPFNGMRGKRDPTFDDIYKQVSYWINE